MAVKGITGKALAEAVGVSIPAISAIVTGKSQPRFELLEKIAEVLGVELKDLFRGSGGRPLYIKEDGALREVGYLK